MQEQQKQEGAPPCRVRQRPPPPPPQQAQQAQQAQEAWAWDEHVQWTSGPVAPLPAEASPGTVVRLLHAAALGLMLFPPLAALLCLASYATTITLGITLGFRVARTQLLRNRWLRWCLVAETGHFLASKLTRWGQARPNPNPDPNPNPSPNPFPSPNPNQARTVKAPHMVP